MPHANDTKSLKIDYLPAYFSAARGEITSRSQAQLNLAHLPVTAIGILAGIGLSEFGAPELLLLAPVISTILGLWYLDHAATIYLLGDFIHEQLVLRVRKELSWDDAPDFEEIIRTIERTAEVRVRAFGAPLFLLYFVLPLVMCWVSYLRVKEPGILFWLLICIDAVFMLTLLWYYAPFIRGGPITLGRKAV
jgi:hypothetical protein